MFVLGISGSPKKGGSTDLLLDEALKGARSKDAVTEKVVLNGLDFKACQDCGGCQNTGICIIEDDMQPVYKKLGEADRIIVASPIFFGSLSAQAKAMIDRAQCLWVMKYILHKAVSQKTKRTGIFLAAAGGDRADFFENAKSIIKNFFVLLEVKYAGELFCGGTEKVPVSQRGDVAKKAFSLGAELAGAK